MKKLITISDKINERVVKVAKENNVTQSQIISEAVVTYLTLYDIGKNAKDLIGELPRKNGSGAKR